VLVLQCTVAFAVRSFEGDSIIIYCHELYKGVPVKSTLVMIASALLLIAHGIVLLFAPEFVFKLFSVAQSAEASMLAQFFAAALIGLGLMNWTARGMILGGIYGRALLFGNFAHSFIGFFVGVRARLGGVGNEYFWIEVALYLAFACVFGVMLFRGPIPQPAEGGNR